ncbi:hypothetical protein NC651_037294 [Populus alba x Populus x berolinensis]|uniref:Uncharacterized protein n=1 Tax=Populus alba x Populus x berolinensis TaxID=444605 RepID=A0AAD6PU26_9ROSI|nr:hypothetical protein NC651_037294 [Populus alba x Populus x berolinensis]KAJ6960309.1 hypothetical protein NC653_038364 [Populus alba x Populus x berolinensis]
MAHGVLFLFHGFLRCLPLFFLLLLKTDACLSSFRWLQTWQQVLHPGPFDIQVFMLSKSLPLQFGLFCCLICC